MALPVITKAGTDSIKIVKDVVTTLENTYSLGDLVKQMETIIKQKASEIAQRDTEILEVDGLIAECTKLGIIIVK